MVDVVGGGYPLGEPLGLTIDRARPEKFGLQRRIALLEHFCSTSYSLKARIESTIWGLSIMLSTRSATEFKSPPMRPIAASSLRLLPARSSYPNRDIQPDQTPSSITEPKGTDSFRS
jgi:hypothetical protein